ncbi:MAG: Mur ligase family protein [Bacilli bacterium]
MKLLKLKNKLEKKNFKKRELKKEYLNKKTKQNNKDLVIIGVTGSRGKSTTALMMHEYLKSSGYKSVLYSSVMVDSPASHYKKNEAYEVAVRDEKALLSIIEEAEAYGAEYLVLEVNESTLAKGFLKDVPFDVRVLTNLNPKHNLEEYTEEEYVELKKSFFKDIEEECKCVLGFQDYDKELLDELLQLNKYPKYIAASNYIANVKGLNANEVTGLLTGLETDIDGMKLQFRLNGKTYELDTNLLMSYNALNVLTVLTTLEVLGVLNVSQFEKMLNELVIPGRAEVFRANGRLVVVDTHLPAMLECLKNLKDQGKVNQIKVVVGSMGHGYKNWEEKFKTEEFAKKRKGVRKYAMNLLKGVVDHVYLTESDSGKEKPLDICEEMKSYLNDEVPSTIIVDREQAIKQAIMESQEGDVVFISGRGNRRVLCNSETTMKLLKDSDVVKKLFKNQ